MAASNAPPPNQYTSGICRENFKAFCLTRNEDLARDGVVIDGIIQLNRLNERYFTQVLENVKAECTATIHEGLAYTRKCSEAENDFYYRGSSDGLRNDSWYKRLPFKTDNGLFDLVIFTYNVYIIGVIPRNNRLITFQDFHKSFPTANYLDVKGTYAALEIYRKADRGRNEIRPQIIGTIDTTWAGFVDSIGILAKEEFIVNEMIVGLKDESKVANNIVTTYLGRRNFGKAAMSFSEKLRLKILSSPEFLNAPADASSLQLCHNWSGFSRFIGQEWKNEKKDITRNVTFEIHEVIRKSNGALRKMPIENKYLPERMDLSFLAEKLMNLCLAGSENTVGTALNSEDSTTIQTHARAASVRDSGNSGAGRIGGSSTGGGRRGGSNTRGRYTAGSHTKWLPRERTISPSAPALVDAALLGWMTSSTLGLAVVVSERPMVLATRTNPTALLKHPRTPPNAASVNYHSADSDHILERARAIGKSGDENGADNRTMADNKVRVADETADKSKIWNLTEINDPGQCRSLWLPSSMPTSKATASTSSQLWQPASGIVMTNEIGDTNPEQGVACFALSKNDTYVISASGGKVLLFNTMTFKKMTSLMSPPPAATFLAFHPQDNNIIAIGTDDSVIQIYNVRIHELKSKLRGHQKRVTGLAFSQLQNVLVSSGADAQLCVWGIDVWEKLSKPLQIPADRTPSPQAKTQVQFHQDQTHVLVVHESQLAIYEVTKLECMRQWVPRDSLPAPISYATFSCDSQFIYTSFVDGCIGVFHTSTLHLRCRIGSMAYLPPGISPGAHPLAIAAYPPDPTQFALGSSDGAFQVIEPSDSEGKWRAASPLENGSTSSAVVVLAAGILGPNQAQR